MITKIVSGKTLKRLGINIPKINDYYKLTKDGSKISVNHYNGLSSYFLCNTNCPTPENEKLISYVNKEVGNEI